METESKAIPTALGSVIRSRITGMTLVRMRAGWANFNQSVNHPDAGIVAAPEEWIVQYDAAAPQSDADVLRKYAKDQEVMWNVARRAVEDVLVDFRDSGLSILGRGNGVVIAYPDGTPSDIIRVGTEDAIRIGMEALVDHIEREANR